LVLSYKKILLPYDGSKPSENALQQAIHIINDLITCRRETTNSMQGECIEIILLHIVEEIHVRFPNIYIGLRMLAGKPLKVFFKEVYEEIRKESSKMLEDTKKRLESAIQIDRDNTSTKPLPLSVTVITQVVIGNPAQVIIDVANNKQKVELIIMGSTGLRGFSKVRALGSVSRHVCENADCPVMLVH
jgi:nucleotide-binding universal stress UspA family protein